MGAEGVGGIVGSLNIDMFHLNPQSKPDELDGSVKQLFGDEPGNTERAAS